MREIAERLTHHKLKEAKANARNAMIEAMLDSFDKQDDPLVGSFWYDADQDELFGVYSVLAEDIPFRNSTQWGCEIKTGSRLHSAIWKKESYRCKDKRFFGDYTKIPRGRVFEFKDEGFVVFTGNWIDDYPQVKDMILDEFQLPKDNTEFRKDVHWELGNGWLDEF